MQPVLTDTSSEGMLSALQSDMRAAWASLGRGPNCELFEAPELTRLFTGIPLPIYNTVMSLDVSTERADQLIEETLTYYKAKAMPCSWWLGPWTKPVNYDSRMRRFKPALVEQVPAMAMDLAQLPDMPPLPPGLVIEEVLDDRSLRDYVVVDFDSFGFNASHVDRMLEILQGIGYGPDRLWRHFKASRDGQHVGNASLFTGAGAAGLYSVGTVPAARRQGIATAIVLRVLGEARRWGYRVSTLQASTLGQAIYERIGFREYATIDLYEWHPPAGS